MKEMLEITPQILAGLREKAEAATPGPWKLYKQSSEDRGNSYGVKVPAPVHWIVPPLNIPCENAAHIAAANPDVVLALLAEIERLNQRYDEQKLLATRMIEHAAGQKKEIERLKGERGWQI